MSRSVWYALALSPIVALAAEAGMKPGTGATVDMNCSRTLEKRSAIPAKIDQLFAATADDLDAHAQWIGQKDKTAKSEYEALSKVAHEHRESTEMMSKLSDTMTKTARTFGASPHDINSPLMAKALDADARYARTERELAQLLLQDAEETEQRIQKMRTGSGGN